MIMRKTKYLIGLGFILLGVGIVAATMLPSSFQYYVTVSELKAKGQELVGKELKVAGKVKPGSIQRSGKDLNLSFIIETGSDELNISYRGAVPDTFKEEADVVATGKLDRQGHLKAHHILAKCASRYEDKLTPGYEAK